MLRCLLNIERVMHTLSVLEKKNSFDFDHLRRSLIAG